MAEWLNRTKWKASRQTGTCGGYFIFLHMVFIDLIFCVIIFVYVLILFLFLSSVTFFCDPHLIIRILMDGKYIKM